MSAPDPIEVMVRRSATARENALSTGALHQPMVGTSPLWWRSRGTRICHCCMSRWPCPAWSAAMALILGDAS